MTHILRNPLCIAELATPAAGKIGITLAPGKKGPSYYGGIHDRDLGADLDVIASWNTAAIVTLLEDREFEVLDIVDLESEVHRRFMEWHHLPIKDVSVPDAGFETTWPDHSRRLRSLLEAGANILVHCRGGLGRAGMVTARLLVEMGIPAGEAIAQIRKARPGAIETTAQERWVKKGVPAAKVGAVDAKGARDRAMGALVGLAVGDAAGTPLEFKPKPKEPVLTDMVGGGPFRLQAGQWTDDTAMALALADWLIKDATLDPAELMARFVSWHEDGEFSCTGDCFDIGNTTQAALTRFLRTGNPLAGSTNPKTAGNGALMRLAPVAVRYWQDRPRLIEIARLQTRTTHGAETCLAASETFADLLADAIAGKPLPEVLASPAALRVEGNWRHAHRDAVRGTGYVTDCLNAALWAVARTTSFRSAILLAANLGDDADTTAAVAGQLAGAVYGLSGIPAEWLARLAWRAQIEALADQLFARGSIAEVRP